MILTATATPTSDPLLQPFTLKHLSLKNRIPGSRLFLWAFLLMPLAYYFLTVQARFRHPLEPLITIFTVYLFRSATSRSLSRPAAG